VAERALAHQLEVVLFNAPPGDVAAGDRGLASIPGREHEFAASMATALRYAQLLSCKRVHVMAGNVPADADATERDRRRRLYVRNLRQACEDAVEQGTTITIEPLNPRDMPGYLLSTQADAHAIREEVGMPNLKVQMDLYHAQIVEGDLTERLAPLASARRPHPDRRRAGAPRAQRRRGQLRLPVPRHRRGEVRRLDRLRIQAVGGHRRGIGMDVPADRSAAGAGEGVGRYAGAMRIDTGSGRLKISDNPYPFWAFCSMFILAGVTALTLSLLDTSNPTASVMGCVVGLANIAWSPLDDEARAGVHRGAGP
jgi:hypothetical protein